MRRESEGALGVPLLFYSVTQSATAVRFRPMAEVDPRLGHTRAVGCFGGPPIRPPPPWGHVLAACLP